MRVENLAQNVRALQQLGLEVQDLKDAFGTIADEARDAIDSHTPKDTGRLAGDLRGNRAKSKAIVRAGRASVPYAGPINYGWEARGIEPALFMQKGSDEYGPQAKERLEEEIERQIKRKGLT